MTIEGPQSYLDLEKIINEIDALIRNLSNSINRSEDILNDFNVIISEIEKKYISNEIKSIYKEKKKILFTNYGDSVKKAIKLQNKDLKNNLIKKFNEDLIKEWKALFLDCIKDSKQKNLQNTTSIKLIKILDTLYKEQKEKQSIFEGGSKSIQETMQKIKEIREKISELNRLKTEAAEKRHQERITPIENLILDIQNEKQKIKTYLSSDMQIINELKKIHWTSLEYIDDQKNQGSAQYSEKWQLLSDLENFINKNKDKSGDYIEQEFNSLISKYNRYLNNHHNDDSISILNNIFDAIGIHNHEITINYGTINRSEGTDIKIIEKEIDKLLKEKRDLENKLVGRGNFKKIEDDDSFDDSIYDVIHTGPQKEKRRAAMENITLKELEVLSRELTILDNKIAKNQNELIDLLGKTKNADTNKIIDFYGINIEGINSMFETDPSNNNVSSQPKNSEKLLERDNRVCSFIKILLKNNILSISDLQDEAKISIKREESSRSPYYYICLHKMNKIFCINNNYGNNTFVYYSDNFENLKMLFKSKKTIKDEFDTNKTGEYFRYDNAKDRERHIRYILLGSNSDNLTNGKISKINGKLDQTNSINIATAEDIRSYHKTNNMVITSSIDYLSYKDDFYKKTGKRLPDFNEVFNLLGATSDCKDTKYLLQLLISVEAGIKYLDSLNKADKIFLKNDTEIVIEFKKFLKLQPELIKHIADNNVGKIEQIGKSFEKYLNDKNISTGGKHLGMDKSIIISFLGGERWLRDKSFCKEYIEQLIKDDGNPQNIIDEYFKSSDGQKMKEICYNTLSFIAEYFKEVYINKKFPINEDSYNDIIVKDKEKFKEFREAKGKGEIKNFKNIFPSRTTLQTYIDILTAAKDIKKGTTLSDRMNECIG